MLATAKQSQRGTLPGGYGGEDGGDGVDGGGDGGGGGVVASVDSSPAFAQAQPPPLRETNSLHEYATRPTQDSLLHATLRGLTPRPPRILRRQCTLHPPLHAYETTGQGAHLLSSNRRA